MKRRITWLDDCALATIVFFEPFAFLALGFAKFAFAFSLVFRCLAGMLSLFFAPFTFIFARFFSRLALILECFTFVFKLLFQAFLFGFYEFAIVFFILLLALALNLGEFASVFSLCIVSEHARDQKCRCECSDNCASQKTTVHSFSLQNEVALNLGNGFH